MATTLYEPVDAPLPVPSPRGLLEVARVTRRLDGQISTAPEDVQTQDGTLTPRGAGPKWASGGVSFEAEACGSATVVDGCTQFSESGTPVSSSSGGVIDARATFVRAGARCSTLGDVDDATRDKAIRLLNIWQHQAVAREFWRGDLSDQLNTGTPYLSDLNATILGTDLTPIDGLGALEAAVTAGLEGSACGPGQRAMIHASPRLVNEWAAAGLLRVEGGLVLTILDSVIVTGPGYDGSATPGPHDPPTGDPSGAADWQWAYGTGFVDVRLGPVRVISTIDQAANTRIAWAERAGLVTFAPCCQVSAAIDLTERI